MLPAFGWQAVLTRWEFAPAVTTAVAAAALLYLWGAWRVGRRHPARPWPWWRTAVFLTGLAVVTVALQSGIGVYDDALYWDHMIQHLLLLMVAPPLLVAGQPVTLLLHASRNPLHTWAKRAIRSRAVGVLTWPPFGLAAYLVTIAATHLTGLAHVINENQAVHDAEHVLYLVAGYLFFLPLIGQEPIRWRVSYPVRVLVLAIAMPVDTFTGLILGYQGAAFARGVAEVRPPGSPSPVEDVHWAGAIMWIGGDAIMFVFMMLVVWLWSRDDRAGWAHRGWLETARRASFEQLVRAPAGGQGGSAGQGGSSGQGRAAARAGRPGTGGGAAGIDDDEHLAAYNEYLARLNGARHGKTS